VLLRLDSVQRHFGGVRAVDGVSLEVEHGSIYGLIGPNGAGKTTLVNVITGYAKADAGEVYLADRRITNSVPTVCVFFAGDSPWISAMRRSKLAASSPRHSS